MSLRPTAEPSGVQSAIYEGQVRHRRKVPKPHAFRYGLYQLYLDLDELPALFDPFSLWSARGRALGEFRRSDYFGDPDQPLGQAIRDLVGGRLGRRPGGPVRLLTHPRTFGHVFNPVSFYYCFEKGPEPRAEREPPAEELAAIVAHITNTPWGEDHAYVLDPEAGRRVGESLHFDLAKDFHVSPFMDMNIQYGWRFTVPGQSLAVHMESFEAEKKIFDATLSLRRLPLGEAGLRRVLLRYPFLGAKVVAGIYYQAFRLWLKRTPFFVHPEKREPESRPLGGTKS